MKLQPNRATQLTAYVDASWASDSEKNRQSRSGALLIYGPAVVAATTGLQKMFSLTEAEYVKVSKTPKTVVWLPNLLC